MGIEIMRKKTISICILGIMLVTTGLSANATVLKNGQESRTFDNISDLPEFRSIVNNIETSFWNYHKRIRSSLEKKELIEKEQPIKISQ